MEVRRKKLSDLQIDSRYYVHGYYHVSTKYGDNYILTCCMDNSEEKFEIYAPKLVKAYIDTNLPENRFYFTIRKNSNCIYAEIPEYRPGYITLN